MRRLIARSPKGRCPLGVIKENEEKIPHPREETKGEEGPGHRYAKVDALSRGLVTHSLLESVSRVGPLLEAARARLALYVGGSIVLQGRLIVLFIIPSDKRFGVSAIRKNPVDANDAAEKEKEENDSPPT
ncbi:PREDICTED: uncharacterized protein LOC108762574 [Trachymyrmex cornetzi]|uniref:uncharacterized protein LOC108762574 n=1 Tax=Trachymyrmex cornetzi TaxID=471704 RepID=UPI00084F1588|nr:PREDICTED: uncharacterized protein LOC108762574 [Trachymyrmex cornetzi]